MTDRSNAYHVPSVLLEEQENEDNCAQYLLCMHCGYCIVTGVLVTMLNLLRTDVISRDLQTVWSPNVPSMVAGLGSIVIAIIGTWAAFSSRRYSVLVVYTVLVIVMSLSEVSAGTYFCVGTSRLLHTDNLRAKLADPSFVKGYLIIINGFHRLNKCCGMLGPEDFKTILIPKSCCINETPCNLTVPNSYYTTGCLRYIQMAPCSYGFVVYILAATHALSLLPAFYLLWERCPCRKRTRLRSLQISA